MRYIIFYLFFTLTLNAVELITPIPKNASYNLEKSKIGEMLFFDPMLSKDKNISCASCHKPQAGWADRSNRSTGVYGQKDIIHTPTVLNSVFNFKLFWNGRANTFEQQLDNTFHNKIEMGMTKELIEKRVKQNTDYIKQFKKIYGTDNISYKLVIDALSEYLKSLITPDSKYDQYLRGEVEINQKERDGLILFKKLGCITCHNGINVGGNSFQKIGIIFEFENCTNDRSTITKRTLDRCVYKVPSLRNISKTKPYFHDASAKTLKDAIEKMAYYNLGYILNKNDIESIEVFLKTLTGTLPNNTER